MRKKTISFASNIDFFDVPKPAKFYIPKWYKDTPVYIDENAPRAQLLKTLKHCIPFMDSITLGYIQEIPLDIEVQRISNIPSFVWRLGDINIISSKTDGSYGLMNVPEGYDKKMYSFEHNLYIKTPPGYSILITQPFNRTDLPFYALSGVVDTDKNPMFPGNYPVFIKSNFEGIINKGTPILQIIPFKRDEWKSHEDESLKKIGKKTQLVSRTVFEFWYKKNAWFRKNYE